RRGGGGWGGVVRGGSPPPPRRLMLEQPSARGVRSRRRHRSGDGSAALPGLRPASQPLPVLPVHRQPAASPADLGGNGRQDRPGQSPLRSHLVLGGGARPQPAGRVRSQGAQVPERPPRRLGSP